MIAAASILADLRRHGARLRLVGDRVRVAGVPAGALPSELLEAARARRTELADLLRGEIACPPVREGATFEGDLGRAWTWALDRAWQGFGRPVSDELLRGTAAVELNAAQGWMQPRAGAELLRSVYGGRLAVRFTESGRIVVIGCRACSGPMEPTPAGLCFACDLGLDRADEEPARVRIATELREEHGPAEGRGLRKKAIAAEMRRRKEERAKR